jgi:segregation and condensation protein A
MTYQVQLESFRGPLDLLLYLVKHNEVDICDIPIARIAEQFQEYLSAIEKIDVEWAGEFLVTAATLLEIKTRMLLPRGEGPAAEESDPRQELVRQLLEYKRYKEAAALLDAQAEQHLARVPRQPQPPPEPSPAQQPLRRVELWDLVSAFGRLMRETTALQPKQIVMDETPLHVTMERLLQALRERPRLSLGELFTPPHTRGRLLSLFLAVLELIKGRRIIAEQREAFGEVWLSLATPDGSDGGAAVPTPTIA